MTHRWLLLPALCAGLGFASEARAADIASSVGLPGSPDWDNACTGPQTEPPASRSDLFDCDALGVPEPLCMHRVDIDTAPAAFPLATCNDGTPATFYIREGVGDYADRWVIHLEGGAGCRDYDSCLARWCGADGFYTPSRTRLATRATAAMPTRIFERTVGRVMACGLDGGVSTRGAAARFCHQAVIAAAASVGHEVHVPA